MDELRPREKSLDPAEMILLNIAGKDPVRWEKRKPHFLNRLINSVKGMMGTPFDRSNTANEEIQSTFDDIARSAQEVAKAPQLINAERMASITLKLAEAREREAVARKTNLEADMLEDEIKRKEIFESQRVIELLIQRGELLVKESDGQKYIILTGRHASEFKVPVLPAAHE
jgi:hypothetical protein